MCRARFGTGRGPVVCHTAKWMNPPLWQYRLVPWHIVLQTGYVKQYSFSFSKEQNSKKSLSWMLLYSAQECGFDVWKTFRIQPGYKNTVPYNTCRGLGVWQRQDEGENLELWNLGLPEQRKRSKFLETCRQPGNIAVVPTYATVWRVLYRYNWHVSCDLCRLIKCTGVLEEPATYIICAD
jgi:hypothetical protein